MIMYDDTWWSPFWPWWEFKNPDMCQQRRGPQIRARVPGHGSAKIWVKVLWETWPGWIWGTSRYIFSFPACISRPESRLWSWLPAGLPLTSCPKVSSACLWMTVRLRARNCPTCGEWMLMAETAHPTRTPRDSDRAVRSKSLNGSFAADIKLPQRTQWTVSNRYPEHRPVRLGDVLLILSNFTLCFNTCDIFDTLLTHTQMTHIDDTLPTYCLHTAYTPVIFRHLPWFLWHSAVSSSKRNMEDEDGQGLSVARVESAVARCSHVVFFWFCFIFSTFFFASFIYIYIYIHNYIYIKPTVPQQWEQFPTGCDHLYKVGNMWDM